MQDSPKLLDVVALREALPAERLVSGQVGTIVDVLAPNVYLVEFCDNEGRTYATLELSGEQIMVLHYEPVAA